MHAQDEAGLAKTEGGDGAVAGKRRSGLVRVRSSASVSGALPLAVLALYFIGVLRLGWISDDAFVSFRAIDNLKHGLGLVQNPPERVMGFTNPLWTLLVFVPHGLGVDIYAAAMGLSLLCALATTVVLWRRAAPTPLAAAAGLALLALSRSYVEFSTSGLENPLAHLLLAVLFTEVSSETFRADRVRTWLLAALVTLNRLDHAVLILPALLASVLAERSAPAPGLRRLTSLRPRRPIGGWLRAAALGLSPLVAWLALALVYYGFPWPNTAYAKLNTLIPASTMAAQGLWYLVDTAQRDPLTLVVIALAVATAFRERSRVAFAFGAGLLLHLLYVIRVGGDFMAGRFLSAPFLVSVVWLTARVIPALPKPELAGLAALTAFLGAWFPGAFVREEKLDASIPSSGIVEERGFYPENLLQENVRLPGYKSQGQYNGGVDLRRKGRNVEVRPNVGMSGFAAGPTVHIIDVLGLTEPLLARIPYRGPDFRIGHFARTVPDGYVDTIANGVNVIRDPCIHEYYDVLSQVIRGPLFTRARWSAIVGMNLGRWDHLVTKPCWRR